VLALRVEGRDEADAVVMPDVVAKDCFEVVTAENERPVETLFPDGPYPPLRDRVRTRRSDGRPDHLDAFGDEHLVEAGGELRVAISDQEPEGPTVPVRSPARLRATWVTNEPVG